MSRLEVLPFDESHLPDAGRLLAARHRRHRRPSRTCPSASRTPGPARTQVAAVLGADDASGAVAVRDGRVVGYLLGAPKPSAVWGRNVWVESAGLAVEQAEDVRDLYAAAATRWADEGRTAHYVLVPAHDEALVDAWFRLAFGHQHTHAVRDVPAGPAPTPPARPGAPGRTRRHPRPGPAGPRAARPPGPRADVLRGPTGTYEEALAEWEDDFDDPDYTTFVAEHEGRVVGSAVGCRLEQVRQPRGTGAAGRGRVPGLRRGAARGPRARRRTGAGRDGPGLVAGGGARLRGDRLAGHEPALLAGLAGARVPADVPAAAPAARLLTSRIVGRLSSTASPGPRLVPCRPRGPISSATRPGHPSGTATRSSPHTDTNAPGHPAGAFRVERPVRPAAPGAHTREEHHGHRHDTRGHRRGRRPHRREGRERRRGGVRQQGRRPHDHRPGRRHRLLPPPQPAQHARRRGRAPDLRPLQAGQPPAPRRAQHGLGARRADRPGHLHVHRRALRGRVPARRRSRPPRWPRPPARR